MCRAARCLQRPAPSLTTLTPGDSTAYVRLVSVVFRGNLSRTSRGNRPRVHEGLGWGLLARGTAVERCEPQGMGSATRLEKQCGIGCPAGGLT